MWDMGLWYREGARAIYGEGCEVYIAKQREGGDESIVFPLEDSYTIFYVIQHVYYYLLITLFAPFPYTVWKWP